MEEEIARGTQGVVYRARSFQEAGRIAAVKIFQDAHALKGMTPQRLVAEMLPLQRLDHANLVRYYDSGISGGSIYIVCEWVEGEDYARRLRSGPLPWEEVLQVAVQAVRALKHAHNRNILHRELKPAHIIRDEAGVVKLLSCGLARILPPPPPYAPSLLGAEAFLPPELANGKPYSRRSDFYALGGVLYALLTGRPPFTASTLVELTHKHCYALPERPALLIPNLPSELDEFICWLLEKNPTRRPANALQLLEELERIRARLERQGKQFVWPAKLTPDTVETAALNQLADLDANSSNTAIPKPLMQRGWIVVPAFLLVVGLILYAFLRPQIPAEELYAAAQPLMQSDRPEDWERAWEEYLEPLSRHHPDRYANELTVFRRKLQEYRDLRRTITQAHNWKPNSEAERAYWRGLRLVQAGDTNEAKRIWHALVSVFEDQPAERLWVDLARHGLDLLKRYESASSPEQVGLSTLSAQLEPVIHQLEPVIQRIRELRRAGHHAKADALRQHLEDLYRYNPAVLEWFHQTLQN